MPDQPTKVLAPVVCILNIHVKKIFYTSVIIAFFISCSKNEKDENENPCPIVDKSLVPAVVKAGFQSKYSSDSVITWFRKDSIGYCAYFIQPVNQKKLAEFTVSGTFVSEEMDIDQDGNFEDSTSNSGPKLTAGCECEIPE